MATTSKKTMGKTNEITTSETTYETNTTTPPPPPPTTTTSPSTTESTTTTSSETSTRTGVPKRLSLPLVVLHVDFRVALVND